MKKTFIFLLGALLCLAGAVNTAASASGTSTQSAETTLYQDDDIEVAYRYLAPSDPKQVEVARKFGSISLKGLYIAQFRLKNRTAKNIVGWTLAFDQPDQIKAVLPAKLVSQKDGQVIIRNDALTQVIKPGKDVTFWYLARADQSVHTPSWVTYLNGGVLPTTDTDQDGLPDYVEQGVGLDPRKVDTDGDGLSDYVEWQIQSDGLKRDTDGDGIGDAQEDPDGDSVVNREEVTLKTDLLKADTDDDDLNDGQERTRRTNPLKPDTDGDKVTDGEEIRIGSNPLVAEKSFDVTRAVTGGTTTPSATIKGLTPQQVSTFNISALTDDQPQLPATVPGYVDHGYEFAVDGTFTEAEISFGFDPKAVGADFKPAIYTYDDVSQRVVKMPDQRVEGTKVIARTTHFSKYILLDSAKFDEVWTYTFLETPDPDAAYDGLDVVFTIDSSGSMLDNDPGNERVAVAKSFVQRLGQKDRAAVVDFDTGAVVRSPLTSDKAALNTALDGIDSNGGTSLSAGVSTALTTFGDPPAGRKTLRILILLTDGVGDYDPALTQQAKDRGITIYTVGLGTGVDARLLTTIATGTGGKYYPAADAGQLASVFDSISDVSDLLKDTDNDGINDYYEKEMSAGHLVLGNGVPVGKMDYLNPDSDGDTLKDGDEVQIRSLPVNDTTTVVWAYLTSHPVKADTDADGKRDDVDPRPLVFDQPEMLIHQSANREGRRKEPDTRNFQVPPSQQVSNDLTFNDYSTGKLRGLGTVFYVAPVTPESLMWKEFDAMLATGKKGADTSHQDVVRGLRDLFRYGRQGQSTSPVTVNDNFVASRYPTYSNANLNTVVGNSDQFMGYTDKAKAMVVQSITKNQGGTAQLKVQDDLNKNLLYQTFANTGLKYPDYGAFGSANDRALSIAIHAFHGHQIRLKDYQVKGNSFSGKLVFHSYDHFGLDTDDEITWAGFCDWFTLQHYDRFNGKYVPPLTEVDIEVPISGSF